MSIQKPWIATFVLLAASVLGCKSNTTSSPIFNEPTPLDHPIFQGRGPSLLIEEPAGVDSISPSIFEPAPLDDFNFDSLSSYTMMSLEECIFIALQDSAIIRELGGTTLRSPSQLSTIQDPALTYADPRVGEEAALSSFDAEYSSQLIFQNNDRAYNSTSIGDLGFLGQNLATYRSGISKLSATGGRFEFNHGIDYDKNNAPSNRFNGTADSSFSYNNFFEAGFRQPLLQGAGVDFNRIAGPNNAPGVNNGVLIARTNTDISLAKFETQLRNLVSDVENAYWDLYYAYRDLESRIEARNGAYKIWEITIANNRDAAVQNQAREQYYRFASEVENAIHGRLNEGTRTNNGSSGGTFRNNVGVRTAERRLRLITGMPLNGPQLIVPKDQPTAAEVVFDWEQSRSDAIVNRPELRRQRWQIKRRELEVIASKNHLLPRVDFLGKYRMRGFGENLFGEQGFDRTGTPITVPKGSSATASLLDGDLQEWELGIDVSVPIGFRRQHAAKRFSELALARERAVLGEQERHVIFGLSNAMGELKRAIRVRNANMNRLDAAKKQFVAVQDRYEREGGTMDQVLEAQRRLIEAKTQFYQSQVENMLALRSVHFEKGTLFQYHNVRMTESAWDGEAYKQVCEQANWNKRSLSYTFPGIRVGQNSGAAVADAPSSLGEVIQEFVESKKLNKLQEDETSPTSTDEAIAALTKTKPSPLLEIAKMVEAEDGSADKKKLPGLPKLVVAKEKKLPSPLPPKVEILTSPQVQQPASLSTGPLVPIIQAKADSPGIKTINKTPPIVYSPNNGSSGRNDLKPNHLGQPTTDITTTVAQEKKKTLSQPKVSSRRSQKVKPPAPSGEGDSKLRISDQKAAPTTQIR